MPTDINSLRLNIRALYNSGRPIDDNIVLNDDEINPENDNGFVWVDEVNTRTIPRYTIKKPKKTVKAVYDKNGRLMSNEKEPDILRGVYYNTNVRQER